jgi:hypothetical protein
LARTRAAKLAAQEVEIEPKHEWEADSKTDTEANVGLTLVVGVVHGFASKGTKLNAVHIVRVIPAVNRLARRWSE